jgi:hypothetical protein
VTRSFSPDVTLTTILERRAPALVLRLSQARGARLDEDTREEIRLVIADERLEFGLDDREEHNDNGRQLEDVIDYIGRF